MKEVVVHLDPAGSFTLVICDCARLGIPKGTLTSSHTPVARRTQVATLLLPGGQCRLGVFHARERVVIG
jgi:hypothetical protein